MINNIQSSASSAAPGSPAVSPAVATQPGTDKAKATTDASDKPKLSILARQLSVSAMRAGVREKTMTHDELVKFAHAQIEKFSVNTKEMNDKKRALEVPGTDDPQLLIRARKATDYIAEMLAGDPRARNPFTGLSRDQLTLIAYDDGGDFTLNERRAAYEGIGDLERQWRHSTVEKGNVEQARVGRAPKFFTNVLEHYKSLPAIEKALNYPKTTIATLEGHIYDEKFIPGVASREPGRRVLNLHDTLTGLMLSTRPETMAQMKSDNTKTV
ncbi:MAG TPA: hypothetical protein VGC62_24095 [Pseudomonas sp.]|uniref:hypothetical protein n=1 Tax=Pseudomonas sp. TaxID=306 RepID=UPI002ED89165